MLVRSRLGISIGLVALWAMWVWAAPAALAEAESLPASVRACAAETDSLKRLVCYDREVARYVDVKPGEGKPTAKHESVSKAPPDVALATSPAGDGAAAAAPATTAPPTAAPAAGSPAKSSQPTQRASSTNNAAHFSARVVSIDHIPNEMVLHLDNGQVWQQLQSVSGDLSLHEGDTVKIDRRMGTYWLTGPHVSGMKVRQKS